MGVEKPAPTATTERRLVSVLFADLTGYTSFAEGRDSEDTRRFLGNYFDRSREVIEGFGGMVEKFIGDAVMAVWGADVAHEDDPERAVRAGFELVDLVAKLSTDEDAPDLALRVGVNTGEAAVGPGDDHMGFVTGDLVNTASRFESAADPGSILVGETTMTSASRAIAFESAGDKTLKGKSLPVPSWKALRVLAEVGGRGRVETLEPPFVGRAEELRLLKDLLDSVGRDSKARMVSFVGEAGIGKSRVVWEFLKYVDGLVDDTYWHEGRSPSYGDGVTFWAVSEMIRRRAGILETDPDDVAGAKLDDALQTHVADPDDRAWIKPRASAVLGIGDAPPGDRAELDAAVRAFFEGVSTLGTTVLVFEDLHWADTALLDFVDELTDWWRDRPILIITLARPDLLDKRPTWGTGRQGVISSTLGILKDDEMTELVRGTVPGLPDSAVETIVERAAGVPLYAVELLRSLISQGDLEGEDGVYRVLGDIGETPVPESLQAVIGARLDRLDPEDRALIQDAAVLGQFFSLERLSVVTGEPIDVLEARVSQLSRRELIEPVRDPRSPERGQYRFLQGLIRDVALGRMSKEARRSRHLAVAAHMEQQLDPEIAVVVASHYMQALEATAEGADHDEIKEKALRSVAAAAQRAADLSAWDQVVSISTKGLELTETDAEKVVFWEHLQLAYFYETQGELAEKYGQMALDYHLDVGNDADTWRIMRKLGFALVNQGHRDRAVTLLSPLIDNREDLDSDPELAKAAVVYCRAMMLQNIDAGETMDRAIAAAEKFDLKPYVIDGLITKASYSDKQGRLTEATFLLQGAIALAKELDLTQETSRGLNNLGFMSAAVDLAVTIQTLEEALEVARRSGQRVLVQWFIGQMAVQKALLGRLDELESVLEDPMWEGVGDDVLSVRRSAEYLAALFQGDLEMATGLLAESIELGDQLDPQVAAWDRGGQFYKMSFEGNPKEVIAQLAEIRSDDWWSVLPVWWPSTFAAVLSGDPAVCDEVSRFFADYHPRFTESTLFLRALATMREDPDAGLKVVDRLFGQAIDLDSRVFAVTYLIGAANFLPDEHPKRKEYLDEARRVGSEWGFQGFLNLIDQFVD